MTVNRTVILNLFMIFHLLKHPPPPKRKKLNLFLSSSVRDERLLLKSSDQDMLFLTGCAVLKETDPVSETCLKKCKTRHISKIIVMLVDQNIPI
jgi:hypothetical protein